MAGVGDSGGSGGPKLGVARFNTNGSLDNSFGSGGGTIFDVQPGTEYAYAVGLQSTGKIVVAGFSDSLGSTSAAVARFTTSGAIDSGTGGFGDIVNGAASGYTLTQFGLGGVFANVAIQPDNKVVAVGSGKSE